MGLRRATCSTIVTHESTGRVTWFHHPGGQRHCKRLTICAVSLSPETVSRCASAVLITKYGHAQSHILDNRFAAKAQRHLQFPLSAAPCPGSLTHLSFIRLGGLLERRRVAIVLPRGFDLVAGVTFSFRKPSFPVNLHVT
jgi:hypothetical protein